MLHLSRVDFVKDFVKRQVPNPFHRALITCRRQVRTEKSCHASSQAEMGQRTLSAEKSACTYLVVYPHTGAVPRRKQRAIPLVLPPTQQPLVPGSKKLARRLLGAIDLTCQLVLRCSVTARSLAPLDV